MPNLDGLQSTRAIRQIGYSAPIVALTAYAEDSNVKECYDSGMDFFLSKPIRRPQLKHVLKTYCPPIPEEEGESPTNEPGKSATETSPAKGAEKTRPVPAAIQTTKESSSPAKGSPAVSPLS